jgi:dTDP-4-amino-4,6-dideoxygalactose transaminase
MQPLYQRMGFVTDNYPQSKSYYDQALSLPLYVDLSDEQQDLVIAALFELLR